MMAVRLLHGPYIGDLGKLPRIRILLERRELAVANRPYVTDLGVEPGRRAVAAARYRPSTITVAPASWNRWGTTSKWSKSPGIRANTFARTAFGP